MFVASGTAGRSLIFPAIYWEHGAAISFYSKKLPEGTMGKQIRKLQTFVCWVKLQWIWACWQGISKVWAVGSTLEAYGLSWKHCWVHPWQSDTRLKIEGFSSCNMGAWKNIRYFPSKVLPKKKIKCVQTLNWDSTSSLSRVVEEEVSCVSTSILWQD